jgi:membrane protease YdiL (CAAX protease family)
VAKVPQRRPLIAFGLISYLYTWLVVGPNVLAARGWIAMPIQHWLEPIGAFGPLVAAVLVSSARRGRAGPAAVLRGFRQWRVGAGPFVLAALSPVFLLVMAATAVTLAGGQLIDDDRDRLTRLLSLAGLVDLIVVGAIIQAVGEEPGWRGFLLPRLRQRYGPLLSSLVLFPVWLFWHLPFFLSRPEFGFVQWLGFSLGILAASIWLTLVWEATGSVLMAVIWHAMVNICRGIALTLSSTLFLATSTAVLVGAVFVAAVWGWRARRMLSRGPTDFT